MIEALLTILFFSLAIVNALLLIVFFLPGKKYDAPFCPPLSVIIPAHNEEKYIASTIRSVNESDYGNKKEIIIVDDGSVDGTRNAVGKIAREYKNVKFFSIKHSGKSSALNYGLQKAKYGIVAYVDADSSLDKDSLKNLVKPLADKNISVSSGIIRARKTMNPLTWFQDIDYIASSGWRYACDKINATYIAPGFAAFRKDVIKKIGGFSKDTLTEDIDTTLILRKEGYGAAMSRAVIVTSVPSTLNGLVRQRIRWGRGSIQAARKHKDILFSGKIKPVGMYSFPVHLFWYPFALLYMPLAIYWMMAAYMTASMPLLSFGTLVFIAKWLTVYGIGDLFYHLITGSYALTPLLASIILSWSLSFAYLILAMQKFSASSLKMFSYVIIFPYFWITFALQGFALVYELFSNSHGNVWNKSGGNSV